MIKLKLTFWSTWLWASAAFAQVAPSDRLPAPEEPMVLQMPAFSAIRRGQASPVDALLVDPEVMVRITMDYDRLAFRLVRERSAAEDRCTVRLDIERAHTRAAEERVALHDNLWEGRQRELNQRVEQERSAAVRQWYENPGLWAGFGAIAASAVAILVSQL
jgi:hypothetical protein